MSFATRINCLHSLLFAKSPISFACFSEVGAPQQSLMALVCNKNAGLVTEAMVETVSVWDGHGQVRTRSKELRALSVDWRVVDSVRQPFIGKAASM